MRKGRSQRKSRGSLPPLSTRPHALSAQGAGPQVVIGLTPARADEPSTVDALVETRGSRGHDGPTAKPTLELVREAERLELVREKSLELVNESVEVAAAASVEEPAATTEVVPVEPPQADFELVESAPAPVVHTSSLATPDEMSIPPAGDLSVEPMADRFFSEGDLAADAEPGDEEWSEAANKASRKRLPEVVERRARFAKYVRWAVGGAAVVCLAALARTAVMPRAASAPVTNALAAAPAVPASPAPKAALPAVVTEPAKVAEPSAAPAVAPADEAKVDAPKVDVPKVDDAARPAVVTGDKTALQEKIDARRALERGKTADAIAAGERSVALDPTDGEAWLLLGAAYQEKGKNADARRAFTSCTKEGKRGPVGECRAMLR